MKINLVMIVKNEERSLARGLKAARPFVDEIIVVDTGSTDRTKELAAEAGAKVFDFTWIQDFSAARNFALEQSDADWNLILDADEYLRPGSRKKLEEALCRGDKRHGAGAWMGAILRFDSYWDASDLAAAKKPGDPDAISISSTLLPRVLPRGVRYQGLIHEQPDTDIPCFLLTLQADHDGYLQEGKGERNLSYLEKAVSLEPENPYYWYQMAVTLRNLKRLDDSLSWFRRLWKGGRKKTSYWVDGVLRYLYTLMDLGEGVHLAEAKQVIEEAEKELGSRADFCFVCGYFYMKLVLSDVQRYIGYLPRIEESYLKCLRLGEKPELEMVAGTGSFKAAYNLAVWYEVSGQTQKARAYYQRAAREGYGPAKERLSTL